MCRFILGMAVLFLLTGNIFALELIVDGKAKAEIVIDKDAARMAKFAAYELQEYLEKISGAKLTIVTKPSESNINIYVGESEYTKKLGLKTDNLKYGAYRMDSGKNWFALLGPDKDYVPIEPWGRFRGRSETARVDKEWDKITGDTFRNPFYNLYMWYNKAHDIWLFDKRGTLNAVHGFLESLGVRWYFPSEIGEVVPEKKTISVEDNLQKTSIPDYKLRSFTFWSQPWDKLEVDFRWRLRLGIHHQYDVLGIPQVCHGMKFVHGRKEFQEAHPEAFALISGERETKHKRHGAPCLSSELMFKKHLKYARAILDHFNEPIVSIDLVDGYSGRACGCELCAGKSDPERGAAGAHSNYVFNYINKVAKEIYKSHPDRKVSAFSYGSYCLPPTNIEKMSPNLVIVVMSSRKAFAKELNRNYFINLVDSWRKILPSKEVYCFENLAYNYSKNDKTLLPVYFTQTSKDFFDAVGDKIDGFYFSVAEHRPWLRDKEEWHAHATTHLDIYILSKLLWDKDTDVNALLDEYCRLFYGPVANEMRAFIDYCEVSHPKMRTDVASIDKALELIKKAKEKADPETVYGKRVKLTVDYVKQLNELREELSKPRSGPVVKLEERPIKEISFDGKLDDAFWKGIPEKVLPISKTGKEADVKTKVKMAWGDNNSLYIGIYCEEPDMESINDTADGTMSIFNGDNIDIHIETPIVDFYQIVVSPSGKIFDMDRSAAGRMHFNTKWNSGVSAKVHKGKDFWSAEIQIPAGGEVARSLDPNHHVAGDRPSKTVPWYFNLGRQRPRKDDKYTFSSYIPMLDSKFNNRFIRGTIFVE